MKPLAIELFSGSFGWSAGWLAMGGRAIGFDIEHLPHHGPVPAGAELVLQDVLTLHGSQFRDADLILASPPCQRYSYMAMPWSRSKALAAQYREHIGDLNDLFNACFRIQLEASQAAGRYIPMVVENVKGAQPWVGPARARFGSYFLWGDVESVGGAIVAGPVRFGSVLRARKAQKVNPDGTNHGTGSWFAIADSANRGASTKNNGGSWFGIAHNTESGHSQNPVTGEGLKVPGIKLSEVGFNVAAAQRYRQERCIKQHGSGAEWSKSNSRKAASAQIAKIPYALSEHIAKCYWPDAAECVA